MAHIAPYDPGTVPHEHFPPQPEAGGDGWNPDTNEWAPSNEPHAIGGYGDEPSHNDDPTAAPVSDSQGHVDPYGTTPDARMNLLDAVRGGVSDPPPVQVVKHILETQEVGNAHCSGRVVAVINNNQPTTLLEENPKRARALIKVITTASVILVQPRNQGGNQGLTAVPAQPLSAYPQATGDPVMTIETTASVEAFGVVANGTVFVAVWEEEV